MSDRADDIRELLLVALDEEPAEDLPAQLMTRLAAVMTAVELGRLLGVAPVDWLAADDAPNAAEAEPNEKAGPGRAGDPDIGRDDDDD